MQLVEVMVAAAIFSAASGSSLQLWSTAAGSSHQLEHRQQLVERMELDRLQLQAHWRRALVSEPDCSISRERWMAAADAVPVPPQLQRELVISDQMDALQVRWRAEADPTLQRERLFTTAGMGLCQAEAPLTDSQVEEVQP